MMNRAACLGAVCVVLTCIVPAMGLEVFETRWGFDGRVMVGRFNPLYVQVGNVSSRVFDGVVTLELLAGSSPVGAKHAKRVYLSPGGRRWLRFDVFVVNQWYGWRMAWGRGSGERSDIGAAKSMGRSCVMLHPSEGVMWRSRSFKLMEAQLMPSSVTAMDSLYGLIIDFMPRWGQARRQALVDWLHGGGVLHVLQDDLGQYPQFTNELSFLNVPMQQMRVGAGVVVYHAMSRRALTAAHLAERGFGVSDKLTNSQVGYQLPDTSFVDQLKSLTRPDHAWVMIYTLAGIYLVLVGPLNLVVGKRRRDYRQAILFLLLVVGLFAGVFYYVGRRGFDEQALTHTLSYVRSMGGGRCDVTQWSNVFVTRGDDYVVTHDGEYNLYDTVFAAESVDGVIRNGVGGRFAIDMPLYSSRELIHRGVVTLAKMVAGAKVRTGGGQLEKLEITAGPGWPREVKGTWVVYRGKVYELNQLYWSGRGSGQSIDAFLNLEQMRSNGWGIQHWFRSRDWDAKRLFVETFDSFRMSVMAYALDLTHDSLNDGAVMSDERVHLFVYAAMSDALRVKQSGLGGEAGYAMYHIDLTEYKEASDE